MTIDQPSPSLSEPKADTRSCAETSHQLEESACSAGGPAPGRGSLAQSVSCESRFAVQFQVAEAALSQLHTRSTGLLQALLALANGSRAGPSQGDSCPPMIVAPSPGLELLGTRARAKGSTES